MAWPHDNVLGGVTRQRVTYDHLSLTQFIQGFTRNVLDESDNKVREQMLWYLNDLMEDTTDFRGRVLRLLMLCSSAKWRGAQYVGRIPVGSTGSGGHMPKNIVVLENKIGVEKTRMSKNHGIVNYIKLETVSFPSSMNIGERSTNMSAHFA